jgi:hypothetical protein
MQSKMHPPFQLYSGHCWVADIDRGIFPESDDTVDPMRSCLVVNENGRDLGPPHTAHQTTALEGEGRYSHWNGRLYFSSSDNSNPNDNGRSYIVRWDSDLYFRRRAESAILALRSWAHHFPGGLEGFRGKTVLEIGPGRDMGTVVAAAALGATRVYGVDRFKGAWQTGWHEKFLRKLASALISLETRFDADVLERVVAARDFGAGGITWISEPFERLYGKLSGEIDLSVSNSTFEHFYSVEESIRALADAMDFGGYGVHNVDFRDHRNFGEPLEFLLVDEVTYADPAANDEYGRGNRIRPDQMNEILRRSGFRDVAFLVGIKADPAYLDGFLPRLRSAKKSGLPSIPESSLDVLSGTFLLRK